MTVPAFVISKLPDGVSRTPAGTPVVAGVGKPEGIRCGEVGQIPSEPLNGGFTPSATGPEPNDEPTGAGAGAGAGAGVVCGRGR